jgi:hypothetical protein
MEDQNQPKKISKEELNKNSVSIIVNETLRLERYSVDTVVINDVLTIISNDDNMRSTEYSEGFPKTNYHGGTQRVSLGNTIKYALNLQKEVRASSPYWSIYENDIMVGYVQLKMDRYYQQGAHPILLIVMAQNSLQNCLDQQVCQAVVDHCFNVFGLECLEAHIDSRDHKFEQTVRACDFQEQIENNNNNASRECVVKIFIKTKK